MSSDALKIKYTDNRNYSHSGSPNNRFESVEH